MTSPHKKHWIMTNITIQPQHTLHHNDHITPPGAPHRWMADVGRPRYLEGGEPVLGLGPVGPSESASRAIRVRLAGVARSGGQQARQLEARGGCRAGPGPGGPRQHGAPPDSDRAPGGRIMDRQRVGRPGPIEASESRAARGVGRGEGGNRDDAAGLFTTVVSV